MMITTFAGAQWSTSPDSNLQIGYGYDPQIVSDGAGGAVVVWTTDVHIHAQKLDRFGYVQWADELSDGGVDVSGNLPADCLVFLNNDYVLVAEDGSGGVYVAYFQGCFMNYPYLDDETAKVQHIGADGSRLWGDAGGIEPLVDPAYSTFPLGLVPDGSGGVYVVYHHRDYEAAGVRETYVQHLDYDGNLLWGETGVYLTSTIHLGRPSSDGQGGLLIGWSGTVHRFNYDGERLWGEEGVYVPTGSGYMVTDSSEVVYITGGEYLGNFEKTIVVQKMSYSNGSLLWDSTGVVIDTIDVGRTIRGFDYIPNGGVALTWFEEIEEGAWEAFVQWVTPEGEPLYAQGGIPVSVYPSSRHSPALIRSIADDNGIILIWKDLREPLGLYGQRLNSSGELLWGTEDISVSETTGSSHWRVVSDNQGGAIITWYKSSNSGIYCQQVSVNGNLGEVLLSTDSGDGEFLPGQFQLHQNYPNPFNSRTTITYFLSQPVWITLSLYNLNGARVKVLEQGFKDAGHHSSLFAAEELPSGLYFYRLEGAGFSLTKKLVYLK